MLKMFKFIHLKERTTPHPTLSVSACLTKTRCRRLCCALSSMRMYSLALMHRRLYGICVTIMQSCVHLLAPLRLLAHPNEMECNRTTTTTTYREKDVSSCRLCKTVMRRCTRARRVVAFASSAGVACGRMRARSQFIQTCLHAPMHARIHVCICYSRLSAFLFRQLCSLCR